MRVVNGGVGIPVLLGLISRAGLTGTGQQALISASPLVPVKTYVSQKKFGIFSLVTWKANSHDTVFLRVAI